MKKLLFLLTIFMIFSLSFADTVWYENFDSYFDGSGINGYGNIGDYPDNVYKWSLDVSNGSLSGSSDYLKTHSGKLEARDVDGDVFWLSQSIDISSYTDVSFSLDVSETGDLESADHVDVLYSLDNGNYTLVPNWDNMGTSSHTLVGDKPNDNDWQNTNISISGLSGNTLRLKVIMKINANTEYIQIDNITVVGTPQTNDYYSSISSNLTGNDLKQALHNLIKGHRAYSYASETADNIMKEADQDPNNPDNLIEIYTGDSEDYISSREHVWAKSHGDFGTARPTGSDLHNLKPCQKNVNSTRGSKDFDLGGSEVSSAPGNYTDSDSWEPRDEVKGDVARILFYMAVRYEGDEDNEPDLELVNGVNTKDNTISRKYGEMGNLEVLLQWNIQDPVDEFEMHRNNVIYSYQHNRNPFIDHPEWANKIWQTSSNEASVIISEICDPKYNYRDNRFLEICNVGTGSQNLNGWQIVAVANGNDVHYWDLSGSIDAGEVLTFGTNSADVTIDYQSSGWYSDNRYWNGGSNDGAKLVDSSGNIVDIIVANSYLFNDKTLVRNPDVLEPSGNSTEFDEWTATRVNYAYNATPGTHNYGQRKSSDTPQIISYKIYNYPNPFNPTTTFFYQINQPANVEISIYNLKGEKVKTLVKDNKNTGNYEIVWDGKNKNNQRVSSGVYLYKMDINNKTHTVKRCVLLK